MLTLTLLGTGGAEQVPVFGCQCVVCQQARQHPMLRRRPCSAAICCDGALTLLDAGLADLAERYDGTPIAQILLTHYHMDHVQGLFTLRWGEGERITVLSPPDSQGCDDLYRHPGLLHFMPHLTPFAPFSLGALRVTPLPLTHSRPTLGYLLAAVPKSTSLIADEQSLKRSTLAYLTDTTTLPDATLHFLLHNPPDILVIDCSEPPLAQAPRNHGDLNTVLALQAQLRPERIVLTHISHRLDHWLLQHDLPAGIEVAYDGLILQID